MKTPVVLSTVRIQVDSDGQLHVDVDKQPYADDRVLSRAPGALQTHCLS